MLVASRPVWQPLISPPTPTQVPMINTRLIAKSIFFTYNVIF